MGTPKVGVDSFIGFAEQVGYTTRIIPTTSFLPMISGGDSIIREYERIETAGIDSIGFSNTRFRQGRVNVNGGETVEVLYEGAELLFKHLFGAVSTSQPDPTNAPNVYNHTFSIADTLPVGLTLELNRGGTSFYVTGGKIGQAELSQGIDGAMQMALTIVGRELATGTASSKSIPTANIFAAPDCTLKWNALAQDVSDWKFTFNNNLDSDRIYIGSRLIKNPVRAGRIEVTGTFLTEFQDNTLWTDFKNATQRAVLIQSIGDTIEGGYNNEFNLTIPISIMSAIPIQVSDEGRITVEVSWKAYRSATENEAKLVLRNTVTSV